VARACSRTGHPPPTPILYGDDDQIVKGATLKVYPGLSHGMCQTNEDQTNADLLAFVKA